SPDPRDKFALVLGQFDAGRGVADTQFQFVVDKAGVYPFRMIWEEGGGDAACEWFTVTPDRTRHLINDSSDPAAIKAFRAASATAGPIATVISPAPGATGVAPDTDIEVDLKDGATTVDPASIALKLDGNPRQPSVNKSGDT